VLAAGGSYLDITPWLCTKQSCAVVVGNLLAYRDDNHLSTSFTKWVSPVLGSALQETIRAVPVPPVASGSSAPGGPDASTHTPSIVTQAPRGGG
jgi:hypothetical protein